MILFEYFQYLGYIYAKKVFVVFLKLKRKWDFALLLLSVLFFVLFLNRTTLPIDPL